MASGSDDKTIRVWHATEGLTKVLKGHSHNIRAITFNPELPWCLVSGAWDATIKLWDVRSGTCIFTITDHNADVYGLSFHPERPFAFVSSSRDTTLRFWSIDALITSLKMQILVDPTKTKHFDTPEIAYKTKGEYRLSSQFSLKLLSKAKQSGFSNKIQQLNTLYCFLNLTEGQEEIMNILDFLSHLDYAPSSKLGDLKVVHAA